MPKQRAALLLTGIKEPRPWTTGASRAPGAPRAGERGRLRSIARVSCARSLDPPVERAWDDSKTGAEEGLVIPQTRIYTIARGILKFCYWLLRTYSAFIEIHVKVEWILT